MNHIKILFTTATMLLALGLAMAQDDAGVVYLPAEAADARPSVKELKVGDTLPDYTFVNPLVNYPGEDVRLSDFRGRLLILEFWSMGCTSCIAGFPRLQQLQEEFGDRIQILLVNPWSDRQEVLDLLERRRKLTGFEMRLPIAFGDKVLADHFPMIGVPHVIWVSDQGAIESITDSNPLNAENIRALLSGEAVSMAQAPTAMLNYEKDKPLFIDGNAGNGSGLVWHSLLSRRIEGLPATKRIRTGPQHGEPEYSRITVQNFAIRSMFQVAYGYQNHPYYYNLLAMVPKSRIAWEVSDTTSYVLSVDGRIVNENTYTYELVAPNDRTEGELLAMMQQDLERYFGLTARWETRRIKCLVILTEDSTKFTALERTREYPPVWSDRNKMEVHIENASPPELAFWMERMIFSKIGLPVVDHTGHPGQLVGIHLEGLDENDWKEWDKHLKPFGLKLAVDYVAMDLLVIRDVE